MNILDPKTFDPEHVAALARRALSPQNLCLQDLADAQGHCEQFDLIARLRLAEEWAVVRGQLRAHMGHEPYKVWANSARRVLDEAGDRAAAGQLAEAKQKLLEFLAPLPRSKINHASRLPRCRPA